MNALKEIEPKEVFGYFEEIAAIPRPSKKEEKIIAYLENFASKQNLKITKDSIGNIIIEKPASAGNENKKTVILQGHVDMVCEKNSDHKFDFNTQGIEIKVENDWIKANNTTLGADNGIAVAMMMAILADKKAVHPPLKCLFTIDEETGLTGASNIDPALLEGDILINLDSEDDREIYVGCAGGIDTSAIFTPQMQTGTQKYTWFKIAIDGLKGGHSGSDIDKGRGNAIKILNRFIWNAFEKYNIKLHTLQGGNLRNAIPREAYAIIGVKPKKSNQLLEFFSGFFKKIKEEQISTEPKLHMTFEIQAPPENMLKKKDAHAIIDAVYACPNGVIGMSKDIKGLVETSTNLASFKVVDKNIFEICTSQRSSIESAKKEISNRIAIIFKDAKASVSHDNIYPGWKPNLNSPILAVAKNTYTQLFDQKPKVKAIHAGLECGILLDKNSKLDIISIGPLLLDVHSPDERLNITSTQKIWKLLKEILKQI